MRNVNDPNGEHVSMDLTDSLLEIMRQAEQRSCDQWPIMSRLKSISIDSERMRKKLMRMETASNVDCQEADRRMKGVSTDIHS